MGTVGYGWVRMGTRVDVRDTGVVSSVANQVTSVPVWSTLILHGFA